MVEGSGTVKVGFRCLSCGMEEYLELEASPDGDYRMSCLECDMPMAVEEVEIL